MDATSALQWRQIFLRLTRSMPFWKCHLASVWLVPAMLQARQKKKKKKRERGTVPKIFGKRIPQCLPRNILKAASRISTPEAWICADGACRHKRPSSLCRLVDTAKPPSGYNVTQADIRSIVITLVSRSGLGRRGRKKRHTGRQRNRYSLCCVNKHL